MTVSMPDTLPPPAAVADLIDVCLLGLSSHIQPADEQRDHPDVQIRYGSHTFHDELHFLIHYLVAANVDDIDEVQLDATYSVVFGTSGEFDSTTAAIERFVTHTVTMAVHPYLRELVASICARMNAAAPPLPLLRPGEFVFCDNPPDIDTD